MHIVVVIMLCIYMLYIVIPIPSHVHYHSVVLHSSVVSETEFTVIRLIMNREKRKTYGSSYVYNNNHG